MQKHLKNRLESAIFMGIVALLVVSLISFMGYDINARAIYENESFGRESNNSFLVAAVIIITIFSIAFVMMAFRTLSFHNEFGELQAREIREFVSRCMNRGYSREESIELLAKNGWTREEVNECLF